MGTASSEGEIFNDYENNTAHTNAHAEGGNTHADGSYSHAEGSNTHADGTYSHAEGLSTIASGYVQHAQGRYNVEDTSDLYAHIVGNGTSYEARSNAHTLDWSGNAWFAGDVYIGSTSGKNKDEGSVKLMKEVTGTQGQVIGFDANGNAVAENLPQEVFYAYYNTSPESGTLYEEIDSAYNAGMIIYCIYTNDGNKQVLYLDAKDNAARNNKLHPDFDLICYRFSNSDFNLWCIKEEDSNSTVWLRATIDKSQNIVGTAGQIVGFDSNGNPTAQDMPSGMPEVTTSDNGKFLRVVDGAWAATTVPNAKGVQF
jgi:hypothetical protein